MLVLPLAGGCVVEADGETFELEGRRSVFSRVSDFAYVPRDCEVTVSSAAGGRFALPSARCERRLPVRHARAEDVSVELRGAGSCSRQVNNVAAAHTFECDRLIVVEVLTPAGNWSSYPPHKHDDTEESPVWNEEIYYFRIGKAGTVDYAPEGYGLHRTYSCDGSVDETVTVRDGDVFLVPYGYHGPCAAAPGYPMYYLNVMAGPAPGRRLEFADDPAHHWIRDSWRSMAADPRCPMTSAEGPTWRR
jgi:5-deoxy-glucuronate isomerase